MNALLLAAALAAGMPAPPPHTAGIDSAREVDPLIELQVGSLPLIVAIPHGGTQLPAQLPDRISATQERYDVLTLELGRELVREIHRLSGRRPFMVASLVHRTKVDVNREVLEGAQDDPLAVRTWEGYHQQLERACSTVSARFGGGLLVDLHGHRRARPRIEIGYLLPGRHLQVPDSSLSRDTTGTSIGDLLRRSGRPLPELVRGPTSIGSLLAREGYEVIPSDAHPDPAGEPYFSGGYTIERHGSLNGGVISAIQLETPMKSVRDTGANRSAFARALAGVLWRFLEIHYDQRF